MDYDVFISYSGKDQELAYQICEYLEKDGDVKCWIAPRNVTGGLPYARSICDGIEHSQLMLLVLSEHANLSRHVESEIDMAFGFKKIIIPFHIDVSEISKVLRYYIGSCHFIDGAPEPEQAFDQLKQNVLSNLPQRAVQLEKEHAIESLSKSTGITEEELRELLAQVSGKVAKKRGIAQQEDGDVTFDNIVKSHEGENRYSIFQNSDGEVMIMLQAQKTEAVNPWLFYDGGPSALLYRSPDSAVAVKNINEEARLVLKGVSEVLVVEVDDEDVKREYTASVRIVKDVKPLYSEC